MFLLYRPSHLECRDGTIQCKIAVLNVQVLVKLSKCAFFSKEQTIANVGKTREIREWQYRGTILAREGRSRG